MLNIVIISIFSVSAFSLLIFLIARWMNLDSEYHHEIINENKSALLTDEEIRFILNELNKED